MSPLRRFLSRRALGVDQYLIDGGQLFRVVAVLPAGRDVTVVELEDCRTLDSTLVPLHELRSRARIIGRRAPARARQDPTLEPIP